MKSLFTNNVSTTLLSHISQTDTTIAVLNADNMPQPGSDTNFFLTIVEVTYGLETNWEIVEVVSRSGATLTVNRGVEGTLARAWDAGTKVELRLTAGVVNYINQQLLLKQPVDSGLTSISSLPNIVGLVKKATDGSFVLDTTLYTVNQSDSYLLARENHTGVQPISSVSSLQGALDTLAANDNLKAPLASPALTGTPTAPTATAGTNTTQLATTEFVTAADNLLLSNHVSAADPHPQYTTAAELETRIAALVASAPAELDTLNEIAVAIGNDPNFATTMTNALATKAPLASPALTGTPTAPTATAGTNTTQLATTEFVTTADNLKAPLASPALTGTPTAPTATAGTSTTQLATTAFVVGEKGGRLNYLINGNFDKWDYATSQTSTGYNSDNRWQNGHSGSTKTHSQQTCGDTERALFNAMYFSRTSVSSVAGTGNWVSKWQSIEDVNILARKTITVSFWAKADASRNMAIEFLQGFGTGGSPSASVLSIGSQLVALTTTWQKKTITVAIPSIVGKTIGTAGVQTTNTGLVFWFDAGSDLNSRTANLGQQSGTFDIAQVKIEDGSVATNGWHPYDGIFGGEITACQRYYEITQVGILAALTANGSAFGGICNYTRKRIVPTVTYLADVNTYNFATGAANIDIVGVTSLRAYKTTTAATGQGYWESSISVSAEL